jgi:hypothetical protein
MGRWFAFTFSECRHGSNETFASQTGFFLGRPDGRKQNARAEEVAGVASPHPRRLFAVREAQACADERAAQRNSPIQGSTPHQAHSARDLMDERFRPAG